MTKRKIKRRTYDVNHTSLRRARNLRTPPTAFTKRKPTIQRGSNVARAIKMQTRKPLRNRKPWCYEIDSTGVLYVRSGMDIPWHLVESLNARDLARIQAGDDVRDDVRDARVSQIHGSYLSASYPVDSIEPET